MSAASFVRAALAEAGMAHLNPWIEDNRIGDPTWRHRRMGRTPTVAEVDAVMRAFDLWHGPGPCQVGPDGWWDGYSRSFAADVYALIVRDASGEGDHG